MTRLRVLSTHLLLHQRLNRGHLEMALRAGAEAIEVFASRPHFDYTSREHLFEIAEGLQATGLRPWSMHAPLTVVHNEERGPEAVNLLHPDKSQRIDAMDEVKRAIEAAEVIPFEFLVVHLGERFDTWSSRSQDYAVSALEHLGAFARPLGVRLLVENLLSDAASPEHLAQLVDENHLSTIGMCLDLGHAHINPGVSEAITAMGSRIQSVHVHDNHGLKDEHLWPGEGTIDWAATRAALHSLPTNPGLVLELGRAAAAEPNPVLEQRIRNAFETVSTNLVS